MSENQSTTCPSLDQIELFVADAGEAPQVGEHVTACETCRATVEQVRANNKLLREFSSVRLERRPRNNEAPLVISIPGYQILSEIRRGGQGVIYRAIQKATKREVALKMLLAGRFASERQRLRFEREIELVASLRHPRIVTLYDSGPTGDGGHFFAMELVDGVPLDAYFKGLKKTNGHGDAEGKGEPSAQARAIDATEINHRLRLFALICDAVQYAHQRGVIHRDLKPANILVGRDGEPHVLDFGVARSVATATDRTTLASTRDGEFMGTFAYAAPEQVSGDPDQIDTRTDVYSLGVILYEMITGLPPYESEGSLSDVVHNITDIEPLPPSRRQAAVNDELETIVLKALAKDKDRRYPSAEALKRDVDHFLTGEPIDAKRDSTWYVLKKMARRHRAAVGVAATFVVMVVLFGVSMFLLFHEARSERDRANSNARNLKQTVSELKIERGRTMSAIGDAGISEEAVWQAHFNPAPGWEREEGLELVGDAGPVASYWAMWEVYSRAPSLASWNVGKIIMHSFANDGRSNAFIANDNVIRVMDLSTHSVRFQFDPDPTVRQLGLNYDGTLIASTHVDGSIRIRSTVDGSLIRTITGDGRKYMQPVFNWKSSQLSVSEMGTCVRLIDLNTGETVLLLNSAADEGPFAGFSRDDRWLAVTYADHLEIWDIQSGAMVRAIKAPNPIARYFEFSPDNKKVAAAFNTSVIVVDLEKNDEWSYTHGSRISSVRFSPDGKTLASIGADGVLKFADVTKRSVSRSFPAAQRFGASLFFAPDGKSIYATHADGTIRQWEVHLRNHIKPCTDNNRSLLSAEFSPDGKMLATGGGDQYLQPETYTIDLLDGDTGNLIRRMEGHTSTVSSLAFSHDGKLLASSSYDGTAKLWDTTTGRCNLSLPAHPGFVSSVALSPDGKTMATGGADDAIRLWDTSTGDCIGGLSQHVGRVPDLVFSPRDRLLASCGSDGKVILWDLDTRQPRFVLSENSEVVRAATFNPDGTVLASAGDDRNIRLWDVATGRLLGRREAHGHDIFTLSFHRDGRLLASAGRGSGIKLWDAKNLRALANLEGHDAEVFRVCFHPNGHALASCGADRALMLWDLTYYNQHIAGNLEYQLSRMPADQYDPDSVVRMRAWAELIIKGQRLQTSGF